MFLTTLATKRLQALTRIHIDSFNFAINQGFFFLKFFINNIFIQKKFQISKNFILEIFGIYLSQPHFFLKNKKIKKIPRQCRELKISYSGDFLLGMSSISGKFGKSSFIYKIGNIPIMIKSVKCNLYQQKKKQLIEIDEEEIEMGGYFIINGMEKMIRLLIVPKKNISFTLSRLTNTSRGDLCTTLSCSFRSVDRLQTSRTLHLHYLTTGSVHARIIVQKKEFFIPIIILIKSLIPISDKKIFEFLTKSLSKDKFFRNRIMAMLKDAHEICDLKTQTSVLKFLGKIFKNSFEIDSPDIKSIGEKFLSNHILIHLGEDRESKVKLLFFMINKLLSAQKKNSIEDNPDSISSQEFLLPGHLIMVYFKERFENSLNSIFNNKESNLRISYDFNDCNKNFQKQFYTNFLSKAFISIGKGLSQIISTGSYVSNFNHEISQTSGLSVSIERINFGRFLSYFRSIHRGKFFFELKNTSGRKLLPQSWGFLCPVHTPDGSLCGILNHIASSVLVSLSNPLNYDFLENYFFRYLPKNILAETKISSSHFIIDGKILSVIPEFFFKSFVDKLRAEKVSILGKIPLGSEIFSNFRSYRKFSFPSCTLLSQDGRPLRPVKWFSFKKKKSSVYQKKNEKDFLNYCSEIEIIGTMEQCFLNIDNLDYQSSFFSKNITGTHSEIQASNILSVIAGATPFSDLNQSPRNMYQCQMSKQSVGTPFYTFWRRDDIKSFFLLNPQVPICRNKIIQDGLQLDAFPNGFNSIVSVITYTGFDMEDAMIINKSSIERGFAISNVYNCFDLEIKSSSSEKSSFFKKEKKKENFLKTGNLLKKGAPLLPKENWDTTNKKTETFFCYNSSEKAIVDQIKVFSEFENKQNIEKNFIKIRSRRRPLVGDKFASRHGQKGVFSFIYPSTDLPFSNLGMNPEIIFNPHGFPSRMTIGVILESMIGKAGALDGIFHDTTPFRFGQNRAAIYHFGEKLRKSGFQFYGNEILYSGYSGEPFSMDIFLGIVNYQRLRHMVLDKYQISNQGPKNSLTRQPIKGKKIGGSIRFGEMERDAILGQGCVFLLHDRLQTSSDLHGTKLNIEKRSFFDPEKNKNYNFFYKKNFYEKKFINRKILLPYVIKFLLIELASINIKINFFVT